MSLFQGRTIVIATMHGKESVIAPLLEKYLGVNPVLIENFNTDKYGTFSGEIKRYGSQLEAVKKKALVAMELAQTDLVIASEGSFGEHPMMPFVQSNLELIILIDKKNNLEIIGHHRTTKTNMDGGYVKSVEEALNFAQKIGFPDHGIIIKKSKYSKYGINKNIITEEDIVLTVTKMLKDIFTKRIYIETDMRAHKNPTRMRVIEQATINLINNIQSLCPKCQNPGFVAVDTKKGLKCSACLLPTSLPIYEIHKCSSCNYEDKKNTTYGDSADPMYCDYCNP